MNCSSYERWWLTVALVYHCSQRCPYMWGTVMSFAQISKVTATFAVSVWPSCHCGADKGAKLSKYRQRRRSNMRSARNSGIRSSGRRLSILFPAWVFCLHCNLGVIWLQCGEHLSAHFDFVFGCGATRFADLINLALMWQTVYWIRSFDVLDFRTFYKMF